MTTTSLPPDEASADLAAFSVVKYFSTTHRPGEVLDGIRGLRDVLKAAALPVSEARYDLARSQQQQQQDQLDQQEQRELQLLQLQEEGPVSAMRSTASRLALGAIGGGVPMSRQSSSGTPMSRQESARGRGKAR